MNSSDEKVKCPGCGWQGLESDLECLYPDDSGYYGCPVCEAACNYVDTVSE